MASEIQANAENRIFFFLYFDFTSVYRDHFLPGERRKCTGGAREFLYKISGGWRIKGSFVDRLYDGSTGAGASWKNGAGGVEGADNLTSNCTLQGMGRE